MSTNSASAGDADIAGVIAPPPLIYLGFLLLGVIVGRFWPLAIAGGSMSMAAREVGAAAIVTLGVVIAVAGHRQFHKAGTRVRPDRPTTALATGGIYRYSRNPLYISLAVMYVGIALAADNLWSLAFLLPTLLVVRYGVIAREEAYLERKFGDDYRRFTADVRRWI
jgi:protein-S-isoprenylcysteine O-methyltransferase Ste14